MPAFVRGGPFGAPPWRCRCCDGNMPAACSSCTNTHAFPLKGGCGSEKVVSSPAETSVVGSGRRTSAATSLPSGGTTTATLTSNANSKVVAKEPAPAGKLGGKLVSAQDPFSQQNFKQYGAGPLPSQHISPQMGGSRQAPSLSPHSPLTSSASAQRSPHSSSTLQVLFHYQRPHYQQALIGPAWWS